ncbi:hypothetical protein GCM10009738_58390 [Kitasatospora viridis]
MLRNGAGAYAVWRAGAPVPSGWQEVCAAGSRGAALAEVARRWAGPNGLERRGGDGPTLHRLFRARAARQPRALAVVSDEEQLSYGELDDRTDRLAGALRAMGVREGEALPICLPRSTDLVVALLAALKAGAVFLPLDPDYPDARLAHLVAGCGATRVLTSRGNRRRFAGTPVEAVATDEYRTGGAAATSTDPALVGADDPAYLIYTSGTTGAPKGVLVSHRSLAFTVSRAAAAYRITPADRVLHLAALGFDTALEQLFAPLLSGATVVLGGRTTWAPSELLDQLPRLAITVADLTPAYWHHLLGLIPEHEPNPARPRLLIVGGDTVHADDCRDCLRLLPGTRLLNAYGVTEAAVTSTLWEATSAALAQAPAAPVPIGRPLPGARVHLLDAALQPVRPGERGEIYLGGPGVALGYWRSPELTAERFLPDPYARGAGERMYRTGDAGRWRPDGNLELLGRFDDQVKVRGFRVDPVEIESVLAAHPAVRMARVCPAEDGGPDGERRLTAYYTLTDRSRSGADARRSGLRRYLAERLPSFMVPAEFVLLDQLPLTPAGKVDRLRLPRTEPRVRRRAEEDGGPDGRGPGGGAGGSAATRADLARAWEQVLGIERVRAEDDFFELGGNSLLLMEMLARARGTFGIEVGWIRFLTRSLLHDSRLGAFAEAVDIARTGARQAVAREVDLAAESTLDGAGIRTGGGPRPRREAPAELLITGATGFCGIHLLAVLLATTRARIHCLVRAPDEQHAWERLRAAHQRFLGRDLAADRVLPLVGDLTRPRLGLTERRFTELAGSLDAIHHLGGQVNFIYPYHQLHAANVAGTREVIRLAGHSRGIPVHYLSTLAVLAGFGAAGVHEVTEETPLAHSDRLGVGYVESKWVAEAMLHRAAAAGLPVTVVRTNDVTGDLAGGTPNTGTEICALIKYIAESGSCPDVQLPLDFVPADRFSRALAHLAADAPAGGDVYHVVSPRPVLLGSLAARLRALGHPVEEVPFPAWVEALVQFAAGHPTHPMTAFVPLFVDRAPGTELSISEMYFRPVFPRFSRANADRALDGSGVELPPVDDALLDHFIGRLQATGWLAAPGRVLSP